MSTPQNGKMPFLHTMTVASLLIVIVIIAPAAVLGGSSQNSYPKFKYEYPRPPSELGIPTLSDPIPTGVIFSVANPIVVGPVSSQTFTNPNPDPHHYIFPTAAASSTTPVRVHPQSQSSPSSAPWRTSPKEKRSPLPMIAFDGDIYYDEAGSAELRLQPQDREQQHLESESEFEPKPGQQDGPMQNIEQQYYNGFNQAQENRQQDASSNFELSDPTQGTQQFNFHPQRNPSSNQPQHFQEQFDNQNGHDEYQEYELLRNQEEPEPELVAHDTNHYNRYERDERGIGSVAALGVGRTTPTTYRRVNSHRNRYRSRNGKANTWEAMELEEPITMQSAVSVTKTVPAEFSPNNRRIRHPWKYTQSIPLY